MLGQYFMIYFEIVTYLAVKKIRLYYKIEPDTSIVKVSKN